MAKRKRSALQIENDRRRIADLYLQGKTQSEIGDLLGMTQQMVSYDLGVIQEQWREATAFDLDEAKRQELTRIDMMEREYWEAWERSKGERAKARQTMDSDKRITGATVEKENRTGDPRYLSGVQWCIDQRCKILGLYAPTKNEVSGKDGDPLEVVFRYINANAND